MKVQLFKSLDDWVSSTPRRRVTQILLKELYRRGEPLKFDGSLADVSDNIKILEVELKEFKIIWKK